MNKGERAQIADRKWKRRLSLYNIKPEQGRAFKTTGRPCRCWACKKERYKRKRVEIEVEPTPEPAPLDFDIYDYYPE